MPLRFSRSARFLPTIVAATIASTAGAQSGPGAAAARDIALPLTFTRSWAVGGTEDPSLVLRDLLPRDVATDARGQVYVLNTTDSYVARIDSGGRGRARFGRKGGGPGEFGFPNGVAAGRPGQVWVYDIRKQALVGFDSSGKALTQITVRGHTPSSGFAMRPDGSRVLAYARNDSLVLAAFRDATETVLVRSLAPATREVQSPECGVSYPSLPVFSPDLVWASRGTRLAIVDGEHFRVQVFDAGAKPVVLSRAVQLTASSPALARRLLGAGVKLNVGGQRTCTVPTETVIKAAGMAPNVPAYARLVLDTGMRIWAVRTAFPGEVLSADVFTIERGYVGTVRLDRINPAAFLSDGRLVSIEKDDNDVPMVIAYAVRWPR